MAATGTQSSRGSRTRTQVRRAETETRKAGDSVAELTYARARQAAETAVDVPVGTALVVADRFGEAVEPWTKRDTAERELRTLRTQIRRELNRAERRGGTARRRTTSRVKRTRARVERELRQRRRRVETLVRQNRRRAETRLRQNRRRAEASIRQRRRRAEQQLRKAQAQVSERVDALV